jgi:phosphoadenosine phosphosulfate reductase
VSVIGWCNDCNVPILDARECGICGSESKVIKSHEVKPIFHSEREKIQELLFQQGFDEHLIPEKLSFRDVQGYLLADGIKFLRVAFSERDNNWYVKRTDALNKVATKLHGSELKTVIEANKYILKEKENEARGFLKQVVDDHLDLPLAVSFSGGKDSTVALALTRQIKKRFDVVFLNTTIELPETVAYTRKISKLWNLNLISPKPSHDFFELCKLIGPPSRLMKWCCKTQKFSPMNKLLHERYREGVIMVRGVRASESNKRRNYKRLGKMKWTPKEVLANPILEWTSLDSWLYIFWKKIPFNKAYEYGFARLGCWACPAKSLRDFALLEDSHPELLNRLHSLLDDFAIKRNLDKKWISSGVWRERKSKVSRMIVCASKPCFTSEDFVFSLDDPLTMKRVIEFFKIFGPLKKKGAVFSVNSKDIELSAIGTSIRIRFKNEDKQDKILRLLEKSLNCIGCGACQAACPQGAIIQVNGERTIDDTRCTHCQECLSFRCIALQYGSNRISVELKS